ncbi:hypothetical protein QBC46DRAFT_372008 [Diplogelasinospora grovesii]|uniref:Uncharacterized protein n=1 Tax=Diplogelasinospora grovesii TaxID=303347 RepID=A0AAN6S8V1_9PEZI|nr:hypothetical protein QBC46DRAFT_372008 [Diplogelasinospora grovesii]
MAPSELQSRRGDDTASQAWRHSAVSGTAARSDAASPQRRNDESWVEISSQPSSSSLSSIGDEIVTTGLRVGNNSHPPRRRRLQVQQPMPASYMVSRAAAQAGTSSQEEYEESESEDDRVMTSSTEHVQQAASLARQRTAVGPAMDSDTDDDDENATALGRPSNSPTFRPQPNAFSHPPSHPTRGHSTNSANLHHTSQARPSMANRSHTRPHRTPPAHFMSPSYQADNDAALRASLTTLLSCAAAARGLPKKDELRAGPSGAGNITTGTGVVPSSQPMEMRLVPESELMAENPAPAPAPAGPSNAKAPLRTASNSSAPSAPSSTSSRDVEPATEKSKRAAATQSKPSRATKKKRTGSSMGLVESEPATFINISPTLLTWVVSAGVVVLVSFGAGYVIGREVGRQEGAMSLSSASAGANASASCGRELVKSTSAGTLKRFRWGAVGKSVTA